MRKYKHIFFDLDRTLWDFDANSSATLLEIIEVFKLYDYVNDYELWVDTYQAHNKKLWNDYELGKIQKQVLREERFKLLLNDFRITDKELTQEISDYYIEYAPQKKALMPNTKTVLEYLSNHYLLHLVTNGFFAVQETKLKASGIAQFFENMTTSDKVSASKPSRRIFQEALKPVNARKDQSLFVGDSLENDIVGAMKFGISQVWYNHDNIESLVKPTYEIKDLIELKTIL